MTTDTPEYILGSADDYGMPVAIREDGIWPDASIGIFESILDFPLDDDDVMVIGYAKSGTNWIQIQITNLYGWEYWGTTSLTSNHSVPSFDMRQYHDLCLRAKSPRLMKAHSTREMCPRVWPKKGKVVHITRNPKDVAVSFYNELAYTRGLTMSWEEWVTNFANGQIPYGPWEDNVIGWRQFQHPNLIHIEFETMKRKPLETMKRVADFLGRPYEQAVLEKTVADAEFSAMKKNDLRKQYSGIARKGEIGDWKNHFTPEQSEMFNRKIDEKLKANGVFLEYE